MTRCLAEIVKLIQLMARFAPGRKAQAARFRSRPDRPRRVPFQDRQSDRQKIGRPPSQGDRQESPTRPIRFARGAQAQPFKAGLARRTAPLLLSTSTTGATSRRYTALQATLQP